MKFLCVLMKPHCAYVLYFLYVLTGWLTFMMIPCCSYCARYRSKKNGVMSVIIFGFLYVCSQEWYSYIIQYNPIWVILFSVFLRNLHIDVHNGYPIFPSPALNMDVAIPYLHQHLAHLFSC